MRKALTSVPPILVLIAVFIGVRRSGLTGGGGMFIIFLTAAALLVWVAKQQARLDRLTLQNAAAKFGFQPVEPGEVLLSIEPLRGQGWVGGAAEGELRGLQTWVFNYDLRTEAPDSRSIRQTVVAFRVDDANLPIFLIRPLGLRPCGNRSWENRDWENSDESICFPDAQHFHSRFELMSSAEEGVRRHFDAQLLNTIATLNDCNCIVQGFHTTVLFFTPNKTINQADEMEAFARKGAEVANAIFSAEKRVMAAAAK
jgi:hypothetical protein